MKVQSKKGTEPTFIIGMPRTGSKIYKNIINFNTNINISPEVFFLTPKWIRKDVIAVVRQEIGDLDNDKNLERFVEYVFSDKFFGTYFRDISGDKKELYELVKASDRSNKSIFEALLKFDANKYNKTLLGAKFPVHITKAQKLLDWFPNANIIHLNRHPLAIYNSQKRKHLKGKKGLIKKISIVLKVFIATLLSYKYSEVFFKRHKANNNYILFEYEDLVTDPEQQIKRLCKFLGIPFKEEMLAPPSKDSSYTETISEVGIHSTSIYKWKEEVNLLEKLIFGLFTKNRFE